MNKRRFVQRGRTITVNAIAWRYRVGRGGSVVAYSEAGERRCEHAWRIKGLGCPDLFDRGQWKQTSDGMVRPGEIAQWLSGKVAG